MMVMVTTRLMILELPVVRRARRQRPPAGQLALRRLHLTTLLLLATAMGVLLLKSQLEWIATTSWWCF